MQETAQRPWMDTREVADYLGIARRTVQERTQRGEIPCAGGFGQKRTYRREIIEAYARGELQRSPRNG